jgi:acyl dehydratase
VAAARALYFEDVEVGAEAVTPAITLTAAHAALLAGVADLRTADPARVHDLLPVALSSGLGWRVPGPPMVVLAFMGLEWKFFLPVRVGDTIRVAIRVAAKRSMKEGGVLIEERRVLNQRDEVVQSGRSTLLVARRPAAERAP